MGTSTASGVAVTSLLKQRVANSALLVLFAAIISIPVSLLVGALAALWRDSLFDLHAPRWVLSRSRPCPSSSSACC